MKVIRITKSYRNGSKELFLVLLDELDLLEKEDLDDEIKSLVEKECDRDGSGSNYGYSCKWSLVKDEEDWVINRAVKEEIYKIKSNIERLNSTIKYLQQRLAKIRKAYRKRKP